MAVPPDPAEAVSAEITGGVVLIVEKLAGALAVTGEVALLPETSTEVTR